ncbi:MAG TPA: hypothetical protein VHA73_04955 [Acidimicrobiales bacterium]|nr:hypothetical protein [Acidimicrobiales bacterium]
MNDKVYIHEYIDIIGHHRARYMHHMTANFSPIGQEERDQLCYGVWGVVGSTGRWPEVVNIWEEDGLDGLASSFRYELGHASLQDPKLARWWARAAEFRSGGIDRLLLPAPWTRTITELCADGVRGELYAHDEVHVAPGTAADYLERVRDEGAPALGAHGWELAGAWQTVMRHDDECFVLWAVPSWEQWAEAVKAERASGATGAWHRRNIELTTGFARYLLVDAPLSPLRIGRQPSRDDRTELWDD